MKLDQGRRRGWDLVGGGPRNGATHLAAGRMRADGAGQGLAAGRGMELLTWRRGWR